jgi:hypothetical protein
MTPTFITTEWASLQAQCAAAAPLSAAPRATIIALQLNAGKLVADCETAQYSLAGVLDSYGWTPGDDPAVITRDVLGLYQNSIDEANMALMRALAGRVASNLNQL